MKITIAHPSEADTLTEIALSAKRHWGYPEAWIAQWRSVLTITPAMVTANETFVARVGEQILGFGALKLEGESLFLCDLWVRPTEMGRGVGEALFREAQRRARESGFSAFEIESDPHAAGFYERMGAEYLRTNTTRLGGKPRALPVFRCGTG